MEHEIGSTAGVIWNHLKQNGESSIAQLKRSAKLKSPVCDWAIGWLAREGAIEITQQKTSFRVRLK
jgi:hypothetical protein